MLFVAEYDITWEMIDAAVAKRMEWDDVKPDSFRFLGEYVWQNGDPAFRGIAVFTAGSVEDMNAFVMHYGPALTVRVHPASDVVSAIERLNAGSRRAEAATRRSRRRAKR